MWAVGIIYCGTGVRDSCELLESPSWRQVLSLISRWYLVTVSSRKEACCALMWKKATGKGWALCPCVTDEQEKEATLIDLSKNDVNPWVKTELLHKRYHLPILWHWAWSFQTQITACNTQQWLALYCCFCCFLWPWVCGVYTCIPMHVLLRDQPWVSFLWNCPFFSFKTGFLIGKKFTK